jgi:hypothetical protein
VPVLAIAVYAVMAGRTAPFRSNAEPTAVRSTAAEAPLPARLLVTMRAATACTLSYVIDGAPGILVTLPAGSQRTVEATQSVSLDVSDAAALDIEINGDPMRPLGPAGTSAQVVITRDNARSFLLTP